MSAALLSKRLDRALDAAQSFKKNFSILSIDPIVATRNGVDTERIDFAAMPTWGGERLERRLGCQSIKQKEERERMTGEIGPPPKLNPFLTLRSLVHVLGREVDGGSTNAIFEAVESGHALFVKVVSAKEVDFAGTIPLLGVQFRLDAKSPKGPYAFWKHGSIKRATRFKYPKESLMLLHRLLLLNSTRAVPNRRGYRIANLKTSFILPIGPIQNYDIAELTRDLSCAVCGNQSRTRCSGCQITPYCGQECQTQDWATHEKTCNSLMGATWSVMPFTSASPSGLMYSTSMSLSGRGPAKDLEKGLRPAKDGGEEVPPNEHGDDPFLIQVQYNGLPHMMVYDRTRGLETHFNRNDNPRVFDQIFALVREKGSMEMKIYVWAKRTADFELSLALDKIPSQNDLW